MFNLPEDWRIDVPLARKYWQKAADLGHSGAQDALERVYPEEQGMHLEEKQTE